MKIYAIRDKDIENEPVIGYLFYYEKANQYIIELQDDLGEWDAPLLFQKSVREKNYTIQKDIAQMWVKERVIPSGRQNIGAILKNAKLKEYNEMALLALSKGKCAQDNCYIEEIAYGEIPDNIRSRSKYNVDECFITDDISIICMFRDNSIRKISLERLQVYYEKIAHVIKNEELRKSVKVDVGGYGISFGDVIDVPANVLRNKQFEIPFVAEDFWNFARNNIVDTTKACELMQCTRQNISYLVKAEKLEPIINGTKEKFYSRGDIARIISE